MRISLIGILLRISAHSLLYIGYRSEELWMRIAGYVVVTFGLILMYFEVFDMIDKINTTQDTLKHVCRCLEILEPVVEDYYDQFDEDAEGTADEQKILRD